MYNGYYQMQAAYAQARAKNLSLVKSYFKKKSVLALGIVLLVSALCSMALTFFASDAYRNILSALAEGENLLDTIDKNILTQLSSTSSWFMISMSVVGFIISVLFILSFFIIYAKSKNEDPAVSPKAGFTILYVFAIIALVLSSLYTLLFSLLFIVTGILASALSSVNGAANIHNSAEAQFAMSIAMFILFIFVAVIFGFLLFYTINAVRFIGSVRHTLSYPDLKLKGAKAFGVCNIILGTLLSLSTIFFIVMACGVIFGYIPQAYTSPGFNYEVLMPDLPLLILSFVVLILSCVSYFLYGAVSIGYDAHIKKHMPRQAPPAANAAYTGTPFYQSRPGGTSTYNTYNTKQAVPSHTSNRTAQPQQPANPYVQPQRPANPYIPPAAPPVPPSTQASSQTPAASTPQKAAAESVPAADTQQEQAKVCPHCKTKAEKGDLFCQQCGIKLP